MRIHRTILYLSLAAGLIIAGCKGENLPKEEDSGQQTEEPGTPSGPDNPGDPSGPEIPVGNPYGSAELEALTTTTTWAGSVFDAIITARGEAAATEYISPDGENFIDAKLGYLAGQTTSVDEIGQSQTTYGKFKFKKDEKA